MRRLVKQWAVMMLTVSVVLSLGNPGGETGRGQPSLDYHSPLSSSSWFRPFPFSRKDQLLYQNPSSLEYDFYRNTCPQAEQVIRSTVREIYSTRPDIAPAILRLVFHDCFIQGCDASVLLDGINGNKSEKDVIPNKTLKGFDLIDIIKSKLEEECPATVSCADIVVLSAREGVLLAGGPFYPLFTGRRDSDQSFFDVAKKELPSPNHNISETLMSFAKRGFNERETVSLLGAHSIGKVHCRFLHNRLYDFNHTGEPDPSLDPGLLYFMRARCMNGSGSSGEMGFEPGMELDYQKPRAGFDTHYYRSLLQGRGILYADQQLMANPQTARLVEAYASDDGTAFRRDFARAMMKLSGLGVLSGSQGQVRRNCSHAVA